MHGGAPSGLDILIWNWVPLRHHCPGLHVALCMSGTWSSHPNTTIHMRNMWKAVAHQQLDVPMGNKVSPDGSGPPDSRELHRETYIRLLVSPKRIILPLFYIYTHVFWSFTKPVLGQKHHCQSTSSSCVKLLDFLSDLQEPLINQISSKISWCLYCCIPMPPHHQSDPGSMEGGLWAAMVEPL